MFIYWCIYSCSCLFIYLSELKFFFFFFYFFFFLLLLLLLLLWLLIFIIIILININNIPCFIFLSPSSFVRDWRGQSTPQSKGGLSRISKLSISVVFGCQRVLGYGYASVEAKDSGENAVVHGCRHHSERYCKMFRSIAPAFVIRHQRLPSPRSLAALHVVTTRWCWQHFGCRCE